MGSSLLCAPGTTYQLIQNQTLYHSHLHICTWTQVDLYWDLEYRGARPLHSPAAGETDPDIVTKQHDNLKNKVQREILIWGGGRDRVGQAVYQIKKSMEGHSIERKSKFQGTVGVKCSHSQSRQALCATGSSPWTLGTLDAIFIYSDLCPISLFQGVRVRTQAS